MNIQKTSVPGCYRIDPAVFKDRRGVFIKTMSKDVFKKLRLETSFAEEYHSASYNNVLRGLHFQTPPKEYIKIIYCVHGQVADAVVDLRVGSPTYGKFEMFDLNAENGSAIYIPPGLAHGFYVLSETAILIYKVSSLYSPEHDSGILWNSAGIPWPGKSPVLSERDSNFPAFSNFKSPFKFKG